jgi:transcriptional regulator with XRE-family HTH domain
MTTTLAAWIIQQLQDLEKSQADFSTEAGIPKANVHYILAKGHIPGHETLQRIADYFKVSILYVYQLAGLFPTEIHVEDADPATVAALNDTVRLLANMPEGVRREFLMKMRSMAALLGQVVEVDHMV